MSMHEHILPLFPLPGLVLFPRTVLPLHIFEPRYVRLISDVLEKEKRLAVAQLRRGWEKNYFGAPRTYRMVTISRILHSDRLEDGRFNILVEGIERAYLIDELRKKPYRLIRVRSVVDLMEDEDRGEVQEATRELLAMSEQLSEYLPKLRGSLTNLENTHLHPGIIADHLAALLVRDSYERQSLLEERDVLRRIRLVNVQLRALLAGHEDARERASE
jgi:Lon protease-like protein